MVNIAISPSEVLLKLSTVNGAAGNSTASTPGASLGKYISTTQLVDNTTDNLIPSFSGDENANSNVKYQCLFVHNSHASLTAQNVVVYLSSEVAGGTALALGVDPTAASAVGSSSAQAVQIANINTAPASVSFSAPTTKATGLSLGNIPAGSVRAIWLRATAANTSALSGDGGVISVALDSL